MKFESGPQFTHNISPIKIESPLQKKNHLQTLLAERAYAADHPEEKVDLSTHANKNKIMFEWAKRYGQAFNSLVETSSDWLKTNIDDPNELNDLASKLTLIMDHQAQFPEKGSLGEWEEHNGPIEI